MERKTNKANRKRALIFWPYPAYPPVSGTHQGQMADFQTLKNLGYELTLFGSDLFFDSNGVGWQIDRVNELKRKLEVEIEFYQGGMVDRLFMEQKKRSKPDSWDQNYTPWLLERFRQLFYKLMPDLVLIHYASWGKIAVGDEFKRATRVIRTHDLLSLNELMLRILNRVIFLPADPKKISLDALREDFFNDIKSEMIRISNEEFEIYEHYDITMTQSFKETQVLQKNTHRTMVQFIPPMYATAEVRNTYAENPIFAISNYLLNIQGYLYFAKKVLPQVLRKIPEFSLQIVGRACENIVPVKGVQLLGYVPDLKKLYQYSSFSICPLIGGTGIQIKILESMACGLPVIALKNIAQCSPIHHGINGLIAENAEEFAEYVIQLYLDRDLCRQLGQAARKTIEEQYSPWVIMEKWSKAIEKAEKRRIQKKNHKQSEISLSLSREKFNQNCELRKEKLCNPQPRISIITPTKNCAAYIRTCIESLLEQDYDNFEHIIIDGGSTDKTIEILKEYDHLKWISEPDHGEADALNKALKMITGDIVCWLNADDWCTKGTFKKIIQELKPQEGRHIIYGNTNMVDEKGNLLWVKKSATNMNLGFLLRWWRCPAHPHQPSIYFSKKVIEEVGYFNQVLTYSIDLEYWLRAILKFPFHYVDQILSYARVRQNSKSIDTEADQIQSHWMVTLPYHKYLSAAERIDFWAEYYLHRLYERRDPELTKIPQSIEAVMGLTKALMKTNKFKEAFCILYPTPREQEQVIALTEKLLASKAEFPSDGEFKKAWQNLTEDLTSTNQKSPISVQLLWRAPIFDPSGYANHSRHLLRHILKNWSIRLQPITRPSKKFLLQMDPQERETLLQLTQTPLRSPYIQFFHAPAYAFQRDPNASYNIGRTLFETDRLPSDWVRRCNMMEEIWVTTHFNEETFKKSGVTVPIYIVPEGIDETLFKPGLPPLSISKRRSFAFLSIFEWTYRKGWDILLRAWAEAFKPDEDVCLLLKTYPMNAPEGSDIQREIETRLNRFLNDKLGRSREDVAPIIVLTEQIPESDMPRLYAAASAYVMPSRGEGWGRPYIEAMAMGLAVIGTRWSGNLEFMNDNNSYLIDNEGLTEIGEEEEIPFLRGHRWASPSVGHLIELMRYVYKHPGEIKRKGEHARQDVITKWSWKKAASQAHDRLEIIKKSVLENKAPKVIKENLLNGREFTSQKSSHVGQDRIYYIWRYAGMGDVLMTLPVARALKYQSPRSKVVFLTEEKYKSVVRANPYVDEVIAVNSLSISELREKINPPQQFLIDFNPAKFGIGEMHQVDAFLQEVGVSAPDSFKEIVLNIPDPIMNRVTTLLKDKLKIEGAPPYGKEGKIILIHAAKGDPNRTWPEAKWNQLAEMIREEGYVVIATGDNKRDANRGVSALTAKGIINLVDQLNPLEFVALCRRAQLLITTDSGVVQLAGASDIAIVGIYTVIPGRCRLPYRYGRLMWNTVAIESDCEYSGCYHWIKDENHFGPWKKKLENKEISPADLFAQWCLAKEKYLCLHRKITPELVWQKSKDLLIRQADNFNEMGEILFNESKIENAVNLFKKALAVNENHAGALNNLGVISFQEEKIDEAISYFSRALEINKDHLEATENLGRCMYAKQSYKEAINWLERALEIRSDDVNLLNCLANCFIQLKDFSKAEEIYRRSYQIDRSQRYVEEIIKELDKRRHVGDQRSMIT